MKFKNKKVSFLVALFILNLMLFIVLISYSIVAKTELPEIGGLSGDESFSELKNYFSNITKQKGAVYAYDLLNRVPLDDDVGIHLLGHVIGDILYEQEGKDGIKLCTHEFKNACSHSIVIGLFTEKGTQALQEIKDVCKNAPGDKSAYNLCFHGLGHGILAFTGYELPKAVDICSGIEKGREDGKESQECIGGIIMELVAGGFHDRELWKRQSRKYLDENNPLFPCNDKLIPDESKEYCYIYLNAHILKLAGIDVVNPNIKEKSVKKAFKYCDLISQEINKKACYGGLGVPFIGFAIGKAATDMNTINHNQFKKVYGLCSLAGTGDGKTECMKFALGYIFWGGETGVSAPIKFCNFFEEETEKHNCFIELISLTEEFVSDTKYIGQLCANLPNSFQEECIAAK